ncbi:MAG: hypothetical protein IPN49_16575 [Saprospiraceae bacterium]|nr:hypothetical protein [Saprospiraceae bacterium]
MGFTFGLKRTEEVVYIGMAGKIKTDGTIGDHSIQKRLIASRGKVKLKRIKMNSMTTGEIL